MKRRRGQAAATKSPFDEYLTIEETMEYLRCSRSMIWKLHREGQIELHKFRKRTLVPFRSAQALASSIKPIEPPK
jgi:excisionase family DNA binding protein